MFPKLTALLNLVDVQELIHETLIKRLIRWFTYRQAELIPVANSKVLETDNQLGLEL